MLVSFRRGQGSIVLRVKLRDSTVSTGAGKTGLTSSSSGLIISTIADNEASATIYAQASSNVESITTLGTFAAPTASKCRFKEVDATNHPGIYEIQIADARFAVSSAKSLLISISGVTGLAQCDVLVPLVDLDPYDAVRAGLTALPAAAAEAAGGLYTRGTGAGQINQPANGMVDANVVRNAGTAITAAAGVQEVKVASIANDAITAAAIAADAIGSSELAASAVTEIQTGLSTLDAAAVRTAVGLASANLDTQLGAIAGYIDTEVAAIKAKTDNLPADPADASDVATAFSTVNSTLATIAGYVDTEVAAIKAKTDNLPASPAATSDIPTAAAVADAVWEEAIADHSGTAGSTAEALDNAGAAGTPPTAAEVADAVWEEALADHSGTAGSTAAALAAVPTAAQNATGALDLAAGVETGLTLRQALRLIAAAAAGKLSGAATTTVVIRNAAADSKDRITATVDADGNRSAITLDLT